jgi:enamine deaminase RidA (YjgF/YER057c/UK114 family)
VIATYELQPNEEFVSIKKLNPSTLTPPMNNLYAQAVIADVSKVAYISGQLAYTKDGVFIGKGDLAAQAKQVFENLKLAIEGVGARPESLVRMTIYVVGYKRERAPDIFGAARAVFGDNWPVTSSVLLGVETLAMEDWLIEVDAIAVVA